jgi:hypothetical protein
VARTNLLQQTPIPGVAIIERDDHHVTAAWFNMVFAYWHRETQWAPFRRVCSKLAELAVSYAEGVGVCQIVGLLATPPDSETRVEITRLIKHGVGGHLKHYSVVHEGRGFKAASIRAVISASQMMARSKTNVAVFSTIAGAADWHVRQQQAIGRNEPARRIEEIILWLRDSYSAQPGAPER